MRAQVSERVAEAILTLLAPLPALERDRVLERLTTLLRPISAPRAGNVLGAVVRQFSSGTILTVDEIKRRVDEQGVSATAKEIYNALGYLHRKGRIQRLGYGQYRTTEIGAGIEYDDHHDGRS